MTKQFTENTCRVCLNEEEIMIDLFEEVEDSNTKLCDLLEICGDLKVEFDDMYPKLICHGCTRELLVSMNFREKCSKTKELLSNFTETEIEEELSEIYQTNSIDENNIICLTMDESTSIKEEDNEIEYLGIKDENFETLIFDETSKISDPDLNISDNSFDGIELQNCLIDTSEPDEDLKNAKTSPKILTKSTTINCTCDICGAGFIHLYNLRKHIETHKPKEIINCSICSYPFTKIEEFSRHISSHDECNDVIRKVTLKYSAKEVAEKIDMKLDQGEYLVLEECESQHKTGKGNHICANCKKKFVSKSALAQHIRIHTGDKPYNCKECNKRFTTHGGLVLHTRRHSGQRPFSCDVCGKSFVESSNLKVHMRIHTGEKPHKCSICDRSFARVFLLQIHLRTHTGERPYKCPFCPKAFAQQGDLSSHKRIHTGERPHTCPYCSKGFIKSSALTQHVRRHVICQEKHKAKSGFSKSLKDNGKDFDFLIIEEENEEDYDEKISVIQ